MEKLKAILTIWNQKPLLSRIWVLGILCVFFSLEARTIFFKTEGAEARFLAAKRDLRAGLVLRVSDLTVKYVPESVHRPLGAFNEQQLHEVIGTELKTNLTEGDILTMEQLEPIQLPVFSERVPKGLRAYGLELETAVPLVPGDRGDLEIVPADQRQKSRVISENCKILGVKSGEHSSQIVVAVTPEEVIELDDAKRIGKLNFILSNPKENYISKKRKFTPEKKERQKVEMISEG